MATKTVLEDLYSITDSTYTTGSETIDGLLIGLATWLLIRNSEFVILDLLTFLFGNRKHRTAYRVLRIWEVLNLFHFHTLFTGFDSDIPRSRFRQERNEKGHRLVAPSRLTTTNGRFRVLLVLSVLLGKLLVFGAEVAIIAFVIPVPKYHTSQGGLGFRWKNTTVTQQSIMELPLCQQLLTSNRLTDTAQVVLCKRVHTTFTPPDLLPVKWIPNGSLRLEEVVLTSENVARFGANVADGQASCKGLELSGGTFVRLNATNLTRLAIPESSVQWQNNLNIGEVAIIGHSLKLKNGSFVEGNAALLPMFSDAKRSLRLAFPEFWSLTPIGAKGVTLNGKLLFGGPVAFVNNALTNGICPDAIDEIIRVTGTLHPNTLLDIVRSGITVYESDSFSQPSSDPQSSRLGPEAYEIGISRKFRIQPEWMGLAALLIVLLSAITSRLNKTRARMARVYREHNKMWSACSASFLEEEVVTESALFQNEDQFHWGSDPGWPWHQVPFSELHENARLI